MNVYFLDPTYLKDSAWKPLLTFLKVKSVYSFISRDQLSSKLLETIEPMLHAISNGDNTRSFADRCAFWLREMIESNVTLFTSDYPNGNCPKDKRKDYTSNSPLNNITMFDNPNCLVLLPTKASTYYNGSLEAPSTYVEYLGTDLATHVSSYCLNILHKKYHHNYYDSHTSFIIFDEYIGQSFRYVPRWHEWKQYSITTKNGNRYSFVKRINHEINKIAPKEFPILEQDGKRKLTLLRTEEGTEKYKAFIEVLNDSITEYEEEREREERERAEAEDWDQYVRDCNRAFWEECGEFGSNCESWPGWD